ncbi:MAG: ABC transporter permease [Pseudomonadota bacterium]
MNLLSLLWANLFRKPVRTTLTLASVTVAFLLFVLLQSIATAFEAGTTNASAERMFVVPKYSQVGDLPYAMRQEILGIDGVEAIAHTTWFGGNYQEPRNFFAKYPVPPLDYFDLHPEFVVEPADALQRFASQRTAAIVDKALMERYGWSVGQIIPIQATIYPKHDGSRLWEFEIVGQFYDPDAPSSFPVFLFNYEYFREAAAFGGNRVSNWVIRLSDPTLADEVGQQIDALYTNSSDPTKTATEDEFSRQFARQLGDIGFITTMIMSAVFFTIILLTGNTMTQALRERIPELAVLKTLGFGNGTVSALILGEALLLCLVGAAIGVGLAFMLGPLLEVGLKDVFGSFTLLPITALYALALSIIIGLIIGATPAVNAHALRIVDALRS